MVETKNNNIDVLIIDGSQWLFAYNMMLKPLWNSDMIDVSVPYYTIRKVYETILRFRPKEVYVVFDIGRDIKKRKRFEQYKAHRNSVKRIQPHSLDRLQYERLQFSRKLIYHILDATPIKAFLVPYVEGDTLVAFIDKVTRKTKPDANILIVSNDKDMFQLIDEKTSILSKSTTTGIEEVYSYKDHDKIWSIVIGKELKLELISETTNNPLISYGSIPYYRAFLGDMSDGIPGIKGAGASTIGYIVQFQQYVGRLNFEGADDFKEWLMDNREQILDNYPVINKLVYGKNKRKPPKQLTTLLNNFEDVYGDWKLFFELMDFNCAINELSSSTYATLYEEITQPKKYDEMEFLNIIREYELNSTNDYIQWAFINKVLVSGDWNMVNVHSSTNLEIMFHKLVSKCSLH